MKILTIGTDTTIFDEHSEARARIESYGRLFDELHIIVYTASGFVPMTGTSGVRIYPTNSRWFFLRPFDAVRIGASIIRKQGINPASGGISVQDPAESGLAGWLLKRKTGLPLHIQLHADFFSPHFRRNSWKERLRYWLARFIVPRGNAFRVVSERIKRSLDSRFKIHDSRIMVLPIFVDRQRIATAVPQFNLRQKYPRFDFIILMVSRLMREKNIGLAIEAFAELLKEFPKTGLVIVGDGPEKKNLESRIKNLELANNVRLEGWREDLVSYYKTADLYLLTSNFEGYGRTVIEAAAAKLPVVMTDVGVAGEIIHDGKTGRVVPVGDKSSLVQALREVRHNCHEMQEMAKRGQRLMVETAPRTWGEYLEKYSQSYEDILRN